MLLFYSVESIRAEKPLMKDFMGLNGHFNFKPELYSEVCSVVRNYHPIQWDTEDDYSKLPDFPMAQNKVNWNKHVYGKWRKYGFTINACLQLQEQWEPWHNNPENAREYAKRFATFFGPSGKNKLVSSVEIGNEPGSRVPDEEYFGVMKQMVAGLREGDPKLKILTCTVAVEGDKYSKPLAQFKDKADLFDIINVHKYAEAEGWPTWRRSYPEDPTIDYIKTIQDAIDYRHKNLPDKTIWLTEFGYDSCTPSAMDSRKDPFQKWRGVSDTQQAQWIIRSFLLFSSMELDRAYLYYYDDQNKASVHAAAGLTRNFQPKPSFYAMRHLYRTLGNYRYARTVTRTNALMVMEYRNGETAQKAIWIVWKPTSNQGPAKQWLTDLPGRPIQAERMPLQDGTAPNISFEANAKRINLSVAESPTFIFIESR